MIKNISFKNKVLQIKATLLSALFLFVFSFAQAKNNTITDSIINDDDEKEHTVGHAHDDFEKCFIALHGMALFQYLNRAGHAHEHNHSLENHNEWKGTASIPGFAVAMAYRFSEKTDFMAKIEFEYGGVGGHQHINDHGGHTHVGLEKSGAVVVERVYITHKFANAFKFRVGHMPIPIGQMYIAHEPTAYLSTVNAKAGGRIISREWQETGLSILGNITHDFKYQLMCVTGLDADYFEHNNFVSQGKQNKFETTYFTTPAIVGRLDYDMHNFKIGLVGYWGNTDKNAQDQAHEDRGVSVSLLSLDAKYRTNKFHFIGNTIFGNATNTHKLDEPIAKNAMSASAELGFNINYNENIFKNHENSFWLFGRVDYSNPMMKMPKDYKAHIETKELSITAGINVFLNHHISFKTDYEYIMTGDKSIDGQHVISFGAAFSFMPYKK